MMDSGWKETRWGMELVRGIDWTVIVPHSLYPIWGDLGSLLFVTIRRYKDTDAMLSLLANAIFQIVEDNLLEKMDFLRTIKLIKNLGFLGTYIMYFSVKQWYSCMT